MTTGSVKVMVGVATRNRAEILPKALSSALAQQCEQLTVMVIDDASTDQTSAVSQRFPEVRWIQYPSNRGYILARNELMSQPDVDFFVSLDDDAWFLEKDEIRIAVEFLVLHPHVGAIAFDILTPDQPVRRPRSQPELVAKFVGCGHVVRLSCLKRSGLYEDLPGGYGGEEIDLCFRLRDVGYSVVRLPGVHVWHDKSQVARESYSQHRSCVCNDLSVILRRSPVLLLPLALSAKALTQLHYSYRTRQLKSCFSGFGQFFKSVESNWRSRKPVSSKIFGNMCGCRLSPVPLW